jgi:hypothetical protein
MQKCLICEQAITEDQLARDGMCDECSKTLGEDAIEGPEPTVNDNELSMAVEAYKKKQAYIKQYNARPDVAAKRKAYMKARNEHQKAALKKAKELGLL